MGGGGSPGRCQARRRQGYRFLYRQRQEPEFDERPEAQGSGGRSRGRSEQGERQEAEEGQEAEEALNGRRERGRWTCVYGSRLTALLSLLQSHCLRAGRAASCLDLAAEFFFSF